MSTLALRGRVVSGLEVWDGGTVLVEGGKVRAVSPGALKADEVVEMPESLLVPGFVDLQVNGGFGVDVASEPGRLPDLSRALVATGVTSYLPTLVSLPLAEYPPLLRKLAAALRAGPTSPGAEPLGLHLEGPFLNPGKKGAHLRENVVPPDPGALATMLDAVPVRVVTLAPEVPGALELAELAAGRGVLVSMGHSEASREEALEALKVGAGAVTHLFNAMGPLHHREPGLAGVALSRPGLASGIIADGRHVHPDVVRLAYEAKGPDLLYLVTDAISAAGMPGGEYSLAARSVSLESGVPRLEDGTIAGSILGMDEALRNVLEFTGCGLPEAVKMAATTPARLAGEGTRKGRLAPGYDADVVALSPGTFEVEAIWVGGEKQVPQILRTV